MDGKSQDTGAQWLSARVVCHLVNSPTECTGPENWMAFMSGDSQWRHDGIQWRSGGTRGSLPFSD